MILSAILALSLPARAEEVRAHVDWQGHPAMHLTWRFFRRGLTDRIPYLTHRHRFRQVAHRPHLETSGTRLFLMAAMAAEKARNPEQARRMILKELAFVEAFVADHPEGWAMARTPAEARRILTETDKRVVIHAIEGGHLLLSGPEDAQFWRDQGVALVTLIHLRDDELGSAGIVPLTVGPLINRRGAKRRRQGERRGLTERGEQAIVELDDAGILVDLSHMTEASVDDALAVTAAHGIPPVVTHGRLASITASELALRDDQVIEIYRQGGTMALGLPAQGIDPIAPTLPIPEDVCRTTIEMWGFHHEAVRRLLLDHTEQIVGVPVDALTDEHQTRLSVGWSSDWNGFTQHSEPVYGRGRCRDPDTLDDPILVDTRGLAHPGLLPGQWERLERDGMDLDPVLRSAERFLQLWEQVQSR